MQIIIKFSVNKIDVAYVTKQTGHIGDNSSVDSNRSWLMS